MSRSHDRVLAEAITEAILAHVGAAEKFAYTLDDDGRRDLIRRVRYRVRRMLEGKKLNQER